MSSTWLLFDWLNWLSDSSTRLWLTPAYPSASGLRMNQLLFVYLLSSLAVNLTGHDRRQHSKPLQLIRHSLRGFLEGLRNIKKVIIQSVSWPTVTGNIHVRYKSTKRTSFPDKHQMTTTTLHLISLCTNHHIVTVKQMAAFCVKCKNNNDNIIISNDTTMAI